MMVVRWFEYLSIKSWFFFPFYIFLSVLGVMAGLDHSFVFDLDDIRMRGGLAGALWAGLGLGRLQSLDI